MAQVFTPVTFQLKTESVTRIPKTEAGTIFLNRFQQIEHEVPFDPDWKNGTGYYDNALDAFELKPGEVVKSYDFETNRLLIMVGCMKGTVIVHERYRNGGDGVYVKTSQNPLLYLVGIPLGVIGCQSMIRLLGDWDISENIGNNIERLKKEFE
jgi:hypothetical protein